MNIDLPGHSAPNASFEVPLEMLSACHHRIEQQCATLQRLVPHLARFGADGPARTAAAQVMRYFDTAGVHHHADEERDLFPALIESMAGSDAVCLRQLTERLVAEHRELERHWQRVRAALVRVVKGSLAQNGEGEVAGPPGKDTWLGHTEVDALVNLHQRHIECEELELLPMAARLLGDDALARVGRAMRERRGIGPVV